MTEESAAAEDTNTPPEERWVEARTRAGGFRTDVHAHEQTFLADEPEEMGGTDAGPTPYDLLAAALATCTTMTMRLYAEEKGWPLEEAIARVRHEKIHAEDCAHCESAQAKIDRLTREIHARGPLTDVQRESLLEIANKCPVHRTLMGEIDVSTSLKSAGGDD